jgi:hypothetical protein
MILICIVLLIFSLLMIFTPKGIWVITESWKSNDATEPSDLYIWSIHFGGIMCFLAGVGGLFALNYS